MQTAPSKQKKEHRNLVSEVWYKYFPYWPLFIIMFILCMFVGWFYLKITVPKYEISASLMLKDETKGSYDGETLNSLDRLSEKKIIENELQVLQSRSLMQDVVRRLHLYASYFEEGKLVATSAYTSTPVVVEAANPDELKTIKKLPFTFRAADSTVRVNGQRYALNRFYATSFGNIRFVRNPNFRHASKRDLYLTLTNPKTATSVFIGSLRTLAGKESTVVSLSIKDIDPYRGEQVLDELMAAYDRAAVDEKNKIAENTSAFVDERLLAVQQELDNVNQRKQAYKASRGAVDISAQGELFLKNVGENDQKVSDVNMQLSVLDQVEKYVQSKNSADGIVPSTIGLKDPLLAKLVDQLQETVTSYEKLKKTTGENNPMVTSLNDQITKLRPSLLENIRNQRSSLEATKLNLYSTNNLYSSMLQTIPQKERDLIDIDREQAIKLGIYNFLRQKKEESALAHISTTSGSRIVDKAQASFFPVTPKSQLIYIIALVFGLGLPIGFIAIREMLNRKILFRSEIEHLTSVPIIGEVVLDRSKDPLVIREGNRTFIAEQFRRIRSSLGYLGVNSVKKKILVTSSLPGEGKSFVAANLALSLAVAGKKVILVEFDLANPSLSQKLGLQLDKGVTNYLWNEAEPEELIRRAPAHDNLFFLPAGPVPENPSELLINPRVQELLEYLEAIFDAIIIDSAPASLLSDAYVLSPMCDATLYVVKHKFTPKIHLERLDESNAVNPLKNMGIIFNGIRSRGFTKNGYGYGYGYGYIHNGQTGSKKKRSRAATR
ncbi:MAG: polysaccharide biosynthesis tyrosine autokinase [Terrimonas ferruginea]|jgi:tyrosine-protein kinase Etk/Wzc|uniref:GumC family protein n=1 Tax=Terrimonas ferruginea TaxID=249 RepID=UPI000926E768|nr:polysaccharide biosynthesis tyrosine autokinase [Terrimonas ferruginea]MBN8783698.1 polysaccharide biosynthesis tyrosine autokinase [Terrimonas ferruginea]OJW40750.1 MAG: hypothetical protein BGO56_07900 [Sphingobacteriales bacterium 48-107]